MWYLPLYEQGIRKTPALPIDKMLYIHLLCPHSKHQTNPFLSKHFHQRNQFAWCETSSNNVKLSKVGSNANSPLFLWGQGLIKSQEQHVQRISNVHSHIVVTLLCSRPPYVNFWNLCRLLKIKGFKIDNLFSWKFQTSR
jgi:hypothetical protein